MLILAALGLAACDVPQTPSQSNENAQAVKLGEAEMALRRQASAMTRTILEGALAGAAVGGGIGIALGDDDGARTGFNIGLFAGGTAGTYVAFVQRKYAGKQRRLRAIKSDLDKNTIEMRTTITVMRDVLAVQRSELVAVRARLNSGGAASADIQAEADQSQANLRQMQKAIDGATARQAEFGATRGLTLVDGSASAIDTDLAALLEQISAMKAIASELASEL